LLGLEGLTLSRLTVTAAMEAATTNHDMVWKLIFRPFTGF